MEQAARLQMVIMFMISSCTALSSIVTTILAPGVVVGTEHRVRSDRIDTLPHAVWRARNWLLARIVGGVKAGARGVARVFTGRRRREEGEDGSAGERERLLG